MWAQFFYLLIVFLLFAPQANAKSAAKLIDNDLQIQEKFLQEEYLLRKGDIDNILAAKAHMINGDIERAYSALDRIHESDSRVATVKKRYLSLLHFIEGDFDKVVKQLDSSEFNSNSTFAQVCLIKVFSHLALGNTQKAMKLNERCQAVTNDFSRNNQIWLINIFDLAIDKRLKLGNSNGLSNAFLTSGNETARIWLKMALFSNREQFIDHYIGSIPSDAYKSKRIREIIGYAYYRMGKIDKTLSFVEDIDSANAENLKGNISLEKKEYELAFGHFKLALKNKENSLNAIERAIPLAWKLGLYQDGKDLLYKHLDADLYGKRALDIAFDIRLEQFELAKKKLLLLNRKFMATKPFKLSLMNSYLATYLDDPSNKDIYAEDACKRFDGINCWIRLQHSLWPSFASIIKNEEIVFSDKVFTTETLRQKSEIKELDEPINVNQNDIEELDGKEAQIPF